tara:strand:+ start:3381 stop:4181 length:801 start_codon:yes stop_codon:yes gene_type:complete
MNEFIKISSLINIIAELRNPSKGCPWYLEQTHKTLIPFVIEEAYEVTHAIRESSDKNMEEELGDLLLQILVHAQIASEEKRFYFQDIVNNLERKLIRRHPHVFGSKKIKTTKEVKENWGEIKKQEKNLNGFNDLKLSEVISQEIKSKPPLMSSTHISNNLAINGLEWESIEQLWLQIEEEIYELKEAIKTNRKDSIEEELGDILFTLTNIGRWFNISPEESLRLANKKILSRFSFIESNLDGKISEHSREELKKLWNTAKNISSIN